MKIINAITCVTFASISFCSHAEVAWHFKKLGIKSPTEFTYVQSDTVLTEGVLAGKKLSQKICVDPKNYAIGSSTDRAASQAMDHCKSTVTQDTPTFAEVIQVCDMGATQSKTIIKITKLSDTSFKTDFTSATNGVINTGWQAITKYEGSCIPEKTAVNTAEASEKCRVNKKNVADLKEKCKTNEMPAPMCSGMVKQIEAAIAFECNK